MPLFTACKVKKKNKNRTLALPYVLIIYNGPMFFYIASITIQYIYIFFNLASIATQYKYTFLDLASIATQYKYTFLDLTSIAIQYKYTFLDLASIATQLSFIPWTYLSYFICFPFYNRAATLSVWATIRERSVKKTITECPSTAAAPSPLTTVTTTETPITAGHSGKKQDFGTIRFGGPGWPWMDPIGADMLQAQDEYSGDTVICLIQITLTFQRWREWCWGRLELTVLL